MQTNGFATTERIHEAIDSGGHDISISLDSLQPANQDEINGGFAKSWNQALRAIVDFSNYLPKKKSQRKDL
jgi:molybdenum cofactor biosynthesis enzyme MoaA